MVQKERAEATASIEEKLADVRVAPKGARGRYSLSGQRVENGRKGLFVEDGRVVCR